MRTLGWIFALLLAWSAAGRAAPTLPAWVEEVRRSAAPASGGAAATVLLDEGHYTFAADGRLRVVTRWVVRFDHREALPEAVARVPYTAEGRRKPQLSGWLIRPDGTIKSYGRRDLVDAVAHPGALSGNFRQLSISAVADAQPGAIFAWEAEQNDPVAFLQVYWRFQNRHPVARSTIRVEVPPQWEVRGRFFNREPLPPTPVARGLEWTLTGLPAAASEPFGPKEPERVVWMGIDVVPPPGAATSSVPPPAGWAELAAHFAPIYTAKMTATPELTARAAELWREGSTLEERLRSLGRAVQQMNYNIFAMDLNRGGGYVPRPAAETLRTGYGDCKDKATLLAALLRTEGVAAYPVVTYSRSRHRVRPDWPSAALFDHCILAIAVDETVTAPAVLTHPQLGRLLLFDPTDAFTTLGSLSAPHQGGHGLLIDAVGGGLIKMPLEEPEHNRLDREVEAEIGRDGTIRARLKERYRGAAAARQRAAHHRAGPAAFEKSVTSRLAATLTGVRTGSFAVVDRREKGELEIGLELVAAGYGRSMRDQLLVVKPVVVARRGSVRFPDKPRTQPILLEPESFGETTRMAVPAGFAITDLPPSTTLQEAWGEYRSTCAVEQDWIVHRRELTLKAAELPPADLPVVREFFLKIVEAEQAPVVLQRNEAASGG